MPSVQYTQKRAQIFYTRLQRQSDIILHFLYFSAPCRRFFLPSPPAAAKPPRAIFTIRLPISPAFTVTFQNQTKVLPRTAPLHPLPHFQSGRILPVFVIYGGGQPAGHIKACKNPKTQTFCIPLRHFFRKCIRGKKRCFTLQKSPVSHTVIWDIQKTVKNHLSLAQNGIEEIPPHTRRKTTKKWRKVSKKT